MNLLVPGTLLHARYRVLALIGQGGMGAVYKASDERLETIVALKQTLVSGEQHEKAFAREARLLAGLRHAALPRVTDFFNDQAGSFLVMDFVAGESLEELQHRQDAPFPAHQVLAWADQILAVLEYLHSQRPVILHRDIKPDNLKLAADGTLVLLDFGLAKGTIDAQTQTNAGHSIVGYTLNYAPLEQINGVGTSPQSDLYALAATLYLLLTNVPPEDVLTRAAAVLSGQPDPLLSPDMRNPQIPPFLAALLIRGLALNPADRPTSAATLRAALRDESNSTYSIPATLPTIVVERRVAAVPTLPLALPAAAPGNSPFTKAVTQQRVEVIRQKVKALSFEKPAAYPRTGKGKWLLLGGALLVVMLLGGSIGFSSFGARSSGTNRLESPSSVATVAPFTAATTTLTSGQNTGGVGASFCREQEGSTRAANLFCMSSEAGDYIGQGKNWVITPSDAVFRGDLGHSGSLTIRVDNGDYWSLEFAPPQGAQLAVGSYTNAERFPFQGPKQAGIAIGGDGRGCDSINGSFEVLEFAYNYADGRVTRFVANFEQHCEGMQPALFGLIRFTSSDGATPTSTP